AVRLANAGSRALSSARTDASKCDCRLSSHSARGDSRTSRCSAERLSPDRSKTAETCVLRPRPYNSAGRVSVCLAEHSSMAQVLLDKVSKIYPGGVKAVDAIDLAIKDQEFIV